MKMLVTGATGFIGSAFRELALARGHSVAGLIRPESAVRRPQSSTAAMTWLRGTLEQPPWEAIRTFGPEACVHAAWIATPGLYLDSPENEPYFRWSLAFLQGLARLGLPYAAVLGTCIEYQLGPQPLSEDHTPLAPTTRYGEWKNKLRCALEDEFAGSGTALGWTRVFYPYGVGEHPARLCSSLIQAVRRGETTILKTPNSTKDYINIEDLAGALLSVVERRYAGAVNLGTGCGVTVLRLAQTVAEMAGRPELVKVAEAKSDDPFPCVVADAARLRSLGWEPKVTLPAGVRRLLEHLGL
jgi:UDP-glucose 4-epimerase